MKYRNTRTQAVITTACVLSGGDWVKVAQQPEKATETRETEQEKAPIKKAPAKKAQPKKAPAGKSTGKSVSKKSGE